MVSERPKVCLGVIGARFGCTRLYFLVLIELNEISTAVGGYPCLEASLAVVGDLGYGNWQAIEYLT